MICRNLQFRSEEGHTQREGLVKGEMGPKCGEFDGLQCVISVLMSAYLQLLLMHVHTNIFPNPIAHCSTAHTSVLLLPCESKNEHQ